ncbi:TPA: ead/Ea22-like family protein, partial [Citrobacter freundii]|nr:ead/Ea22-like family protein [Citrobacter freundii]
QTAGKAQEHGVFNMDIHSQTVLALLDELEAAEKRIAELRDWNAGLAQESFTYQQKVAELESRTVVVKQFDDFQIVHYGGSEDYAKGYIDCQNNYNKALTAAGIGVKGD